MRTFIMDEFDLGAYGMGPDQVCAICMPNGAEAAWGPSREEGAPGARRLP